VAILRYLCQAYDVADHWYPKDIKKQALVDKYLEWQHNNTRAHCTEYFRHKVIYFVNFITQLLLLFKLFLTP